MHPSVHRAHPGSALLTSTIPPASSPETTPTTLCLLHPPLHLLRRLGQARPLPLLGQPPHLLQLLLVKLLLHQALLVVGETLAVVVPLPAVVQHPAVVAVAALVAALKLEAPAVAQQVPHLVVSLLPAPLLLQSTSL